MPTHHIRISGKVQGVFFRATAKKVALTAGITGWIRNTASGEVEVMATGNEESLGSFQAWCKVGPPQAVVKEVVVQVAAEERFEDFKIIK